MLFCCRTGRARNIQILRNESVSSRSDGDTVRPQTGRAAAAAATVDATVGAGEDGVVPVVMGTNSVAAAAQRLNLSIYIYA